MINLFIEYSCLLGCSAVLIISKYLNDVSAGVTSQP
jgi:hypothetical protein